MFCVISVLYYKKCKQAMAVRALGSKAYLHDKKNLVGYNHFLKSQFCFGHMAHIQSRKKTESQNKKSENWYSQRLYMIKLD